MDVKEAVALAKKHVADLFEEEGAVNIGLEEVEYDDQDQWHITIGFSRPWDERESWAGLIPPALKRTYKVVVIDKAGRAVSVRNRETADAG